MQTDHRISYEDMRARVAVRAAVTPRELYALLEVFDAGVELVQAMVPPQAGRQGFAAHRRMRNAISCFDLDPGPKEGEDAAT